MFDPPARIAEPIRPQDRGELSSSALRACNGYASRRKEPHDLVQNK
jgi:hypothetical protein